MTRRILLTLADDTTDTECGSCPLYGYHGYHEALNECGRWSATGGERAPECIAAEAAAARMVEIAPEDAALRPWVVSGGYTDEHAAAAERIERAIEEHGEVQP